MSSVIIDQRGRWAHVARPRCHGTIDGDTVTLLEAWDDMTPTEWDHLTNTIRQSREFDALLSLSDVCALTGLNHGSLRVAINRGLIPARKIGNSWAIRLSELAALAE